MVINFDNPEKKNQEKNELWPSLQDQQCNFLSYHFSFFEESLFPLHEPALCSVNYLSTSATANKIHKQISSTKHLPPIKKNQQEILSICSTCDKFTGQKM